MFGRKNAQEETARDAPSLSIHFAASVEYDRLRTQLRVCLLQSSFELCYPILTSLVLLSSRLILQFDDGDVDTRGQQTSEKEVGFLLVVEAQSLVQIHQATPFVLIVVQGLLFEVPLGEALVRHACVIHIEIVKEEGETQAQGISPPHG